MNSGLMDAQTGLAINGVNMGFLKKEEDETPSPSPCGKRPNGGMEALAAERGGGPQGGMGALAAERGGVDCLRLGPAGKRHTLRDSTIASTAIVTHIFEAAARQELRWPSSADEVPIFAERLTAFATGVRRYTFQDPEERGGSALAAKRGEYGLKGGRSKDHQYNVKGRIRRATRSRIPRSAANTASRADGLRITSTTSNTSCA